MITCGSPHLSSGQIHNAEHAILCVLMHLSAMSSLTNCCQLTCNYPQPGKVPKSGIRNYGKGLDTEWRQRKRSRSRLHLGGMSSY